MRPHRLLPLLLASAFLLSAPACENSTPGAPEGSLLILEARFDDQVGTNAVRFEITALVLKDGVPQKGVGVFFTTEDGNLEKRSEETDDNGEAVNFLVTSVSTVVTAISGSASETVTAVVGGLEPVGLVTLTCNPTEGRPGLRTTCNVQVLDTSTSPLEGVVVTTTINPSGPTREPSSAVTLLTDPDGRVSFDYVGINEDNTQIEAFAGGKQTTFPTIITINP